MSGGSNKRETQRIRVYMWAHVGTLCPPPFTPLSWGVMQSPSGHSALCTCCPLSLSRAQLPWEEPRTSLLPDTPPAGQQPPPCLSRSPFLTTPP